MAMEMQFSLIDMAFTWYALAVVAGHPTNMFYPFFRSVLCWYFPCTYLMTILHLWTFVTHRCCKEPIRDWALNSLPDPISFVKIATLQVTLPLATSRDVVCTSRKIHKERRRQNLHRHPFIRPTIPRCHLIWPVPFVWSSIHEQNLQNP